MPVTVRKRFEIIPHDTFDIPRDTSDIPPLPTEGKTTAKTKKGNNSIGNSQEMYSYSKVVAHARGCPQATVMHAMSSYCAILMSLGDRQALRYVHRSIDDYFETCKR